MVSDLLAGLNLNLSHGAEPILLLWNLLVGSRFLDFRGAGNTCVPFLWQDKDAATEDDLDRSVSRGWCSKMFAGGAKPFRSWFIKPTLATSVPQVPWKEKILHQSVDGLGPYDPIS